MIRNMQAAWLLAAAAVFIASATAVAQATPASGAKPAASAIPPTATDEDIQMLRADIRAKRKQVVAANMTLTTDEAVKFWPLFDEYAAEVRKINDKRWAMMKEYGANYGHMTDPQATDYMKISIAVDGELIALRSKYMPQFEKLLPPKKAVAFYQIDRRLDLLMNIQLSSLIPVVTPEE